MSRFHAAIIWALSIIIGCFATMSLVFNVHSLEIYSTDKSALTLQTVFLADSLSSLVLLVATSSITHGFIKRQKRVSARDLPALFVGVSFSLGSLFGKCVAEGVSIGLYFRVLELFLPIFAALSVFSFFVVTLLFERLDGHLWIDNATPNRSFRRKLQSLSGFQLFLLCFVALMACWLPFYLFLFPGILGWDSYVQLGQYYGLTQLSNHHPVLSTVILGVFVDLGRLFGSDNIGIALLCLIQNALFAAIASSIVCKLRSLGAGVAWRGVTFLFFAFVPVWPIFADTAYKDTLYAAFFALFVLELLDWCPLFGGISEDGGSASKIEGWRMLRLVVLGFLVFTFRTNGAAVVLVSLLFAAVCCLKRQRIRVLLSLVCVCAMGLSLNSAYSELGIKSASISEGLSMPFQQTARYVSLFPDEVTSREREAIDSVLEFDELAELYDPIISDPVKATFKKNSDFSDLLVYMGSWLEMAAKHPVVYLDATIFNTYGYYYLSNSPWTYCETFIFGRYAESGLSEDFIELVDVRPNASAESFDAFRDIIYSLFSIPGYGLLMGCGLYAFFLVMGTAYAFRCGEWRRIMIAMPSWVTFAVCIISPCCSLRYALPIMIVSPVVLWVLLSSRSPQGD